MSVTGSTLPTSYEDIARLARTKTAKRMPRAALVVPSETETLPAFLSAADNGLIDSTVVGDERKLRELSEVDGFSLEGVKIVDINQPTMALQTAAKMSEAGEIDLIVQGRILSEEVVAVLSGNDLGFVPPKGLLSHIALLTPAAYSKPLLITDGMAQAEPDLKIKLGLLSNLGRTAARWFIPNPKTAVVTAVEAIYPQMPATLDGAILAKMSSRGQIKGVVVDGPLSFDIAIDRDAAAAKGITDSPVAGQADAMLASTRHVAAGICQAMSLYAECECGSVLVGGRVPVAINYLSDSKSSRYNSILLAVLLS